jgi:putative acetyltransferase
MIGGTTIRNETSGDLAAIRLLNLAVFGGAYEADLVDRLRQDGVMLASLVAIEAEAVLGHICFSRLAVTMDGRDIRAAALAPVAVRADRRWRGIGARLVRDGLDLLREHGCEAVVVLGHAGYYPRFGFSAVLARKLAAPFSGESFMALELRLGALAGEAGQVTYPAAFGIPA